MEWSEPVYCLPGAVDRQPVETLESYKSRPRNYWFLNYLFLYGFFMNFPQCSSFSLTGSLLQLHTVFAVQI